MIERRAVYLWMTYPKLLSPYRRFTDGPHRNQLDRTDWARLEFEALKSSLWTWTEKVNGTNIRIGWDGYTVRIGGRTDNAQLRADLLTHLHETFPEELMEQVFGKDPAMLFGEGFGAGIQGGGKYSSSVSFALFDVRIDKWWLESNNVQGIAKSLGIQPVPYAGEFTIQQAIEAVEDGYQSAFGSFVAEGLVGVAPLGMLTRSGERIAVKIKTVDFAKGDPFDKT